MSDSPRLPNARGLIRDLSRVDGRSYTDRQRSLERKAAADAAKVAGLTLAGAHRQRPGPAPRADAFTHRLILLCNAELRAEVEQAARAEGMSVAAWLRVAAIEKLARG